MKRVIAILLASLLLGLVPAAQAEAKTFKNCTDLRKSYKYGVSLSGTMLNKGAGPILTPKSNATVYRLNKRLDTDRDNIVCEVVRPKPAPKPTSEPASQAPATQPPVAKNPFITPFPTVFTSQELVSAALLSVKSFMDSASKSKPVKLAFENTIPEVERVWITKLVNTTMASLPFQAGQEPVVIVGSTDAFIQTTIKQNGLSGNDPTWWCGSETTYERYCAGSFWAAMNYKDSIEKGYAIRDTGKRAVVAHEIYHVWHKSIDGSPLNNNRDPRSAGAEPLWFREGMANFMGFAIAHHDGATTYAAGRANQVDPYMRSSSVPLREHIGSEINPYGIGQAASEYLVASIGVDRVLDMYRKLGSGKSFAVAFEESSGFPLNDFYSKFEAARKNF
jgi:hypothetical protein